MAKQIVQGKPRGATSKSATPRKYTVVGKLSDGVRILAPKSKPKHFTSKQIKATIQELRRTSKTGGGAVGED